MTHSVNLCKLQDLCEVTSSWEALFLSREGTGSVGDAYDVRDWVGQLGTHELVQESVAKGVELLNGHCGPTTCSS